MNIVKFKDLIIEGDDVFNMYLKGKYLYAVNWQWVHPITSDFGNREYINASQNIEDLKIKIPLEPYLDYIDMEETIKINDTKEYVYKNSIVTSNDITIDDIKKFRTKLAEWLFDYNNIMEVFSDEELIMVNYYKNNMNDNVIQTLVTVMGINYHPLSVTTQVTTSTCGCGSSITPQIVGGTSCDTLTNYRNMLRHRMFITFSNYNFWLDKKEICQRIIQYLQNIIDTGLPLTNENQDDVSCANLNINLQELYQRNLKDVIKSFNYIINDDIVGHKNFIIQALVKFAEMYEKLQW